MLSKHGKTRFSGLPEEVERILEIFGSTSTLNFIFFDLFICLLLFRTKCVIYGLLGYYLHS